MKDTLIAIAYLLEMGVVLSSGRTRLPFESVVVVRCT